MRTNNVTVTGEVNLLNHLEETTEMLDESPHDESPHDEATIRRAFWRSLYGILIVVFLVAGVVFFRRSSDKVSTDTVDVTLPSERTANVVHPPVVSFRDVTLEAGIDFVHYNGAAGEKMLPETMGGGCAFFDFDNDGDQDILFVNGDDWPWDPPTDKRNTAALYENDGRGHFINVAEERGIDAEIYGMGVAVGDYDNDGDVDVFLSAVGKNRLYRNDDGHFVDVTDDAGVAGEANRWSSSCGFFDVDRDGLLDLFVCNYVEWSRETDLAQDFQLTGIGRAYGPPTAFAGTFSYLYRNRGDGTFEDISAKSGIQVVNPSTGKPLGKSLGLAPVDINRDGWIDVIVANDTVQNFVFINQRDGTFVERGVDYGVAFDSQGKARGAMGIDSATIRNSECLAVAVANFANEMTAFYVCSPPHQFFTDDAIPTGLGPETRLDLSFGLFFFDFDLDGREDLLSANGHLENEIHTVQSSQHYRQPAKLFWNAGETGESEFVPMTPEYVGKDLTEPIVGRGAAFADIDADGDLDVLLTQIGGRPKLLRNEQNLDHHFLRLMLIGNGTSSNRDAIGAEVEIRIGDQIRRRQIMPTRSYLSQVELPVTVGLGHVNRVDRVTVRWPDGREQDITASAVVDEFTAVIQKD